MAEYFHYFRTLLRARTVQAERNQTCLNC
jgi:hypothetical protein